MEKANIEKLIMQNKQAWEKSSVEYTKFCKAYYLNL